MIDPHPKIAITRETHWIPRYYRRGKGLTAEGRVTRELFEALAGDLLPEFGYERTVSRISPKIAETVEHCRAWWQTKTARKASRNTRAGRAA